MRVFVTGHRGYIGSHLVDLLKQAGDEVVGCDVGLFDGCEWEPLVAPDRELDLDVRKVEPAHLEGCDAVMHLAALSNDPMGEVNAQLTLDVNRDASIRLARLAKQAGVGRFLFAGSCSVYGKGEKLDLEESDPLNPLTAYARSKIDTEQALWELADDGFSPSVLRNSTAYGHSRNLRIDLVVNNLLGSALSYGEIRPGASTRHHYRPNTELPVRAPSFGGLSFFFCSSLTISRPSTCRRLSSTSLCISSLSTSR